MGTHPIFESDFDCLTVYRKVNLTMTDYDKGNVVTSQPGGPSEWSTPLCGAACCCGHPAADCCKAWCCPCLVHGAVAEKLGDDRGHWTLGTFFALFIFAPAYLAAACVQRGRVRQQHNIEGSDCSDFCAVWCCSVCALSQMKTQTGAE